MSSDFNVGATSAQLWRGEVTAGEVGIGEWCFDSETLTGAISNYTQDGESSTISSLIAAGDKIQFTAIDPLRQFLVEVDSVTAEPNWVTFVAKWPVIGNSIPIGTLTVLGLISGISPDSILSDAEGNVLTDANGNVLHD